ncbi:glutamate-rich protein 3-like [Clytia hemisphaerica]|uniref:DUF4590 domain-containing protein n=1 Tax=Clytia hemisphaerica TaxID=252671 RepID=A0A7M5V6M0_9CNID
MASYTAGQFANYNSLTDKNLSGYFANTQMRKHLVRSGLITKNGKITSENSYRLKIAKREHREHVKDLLATAIVEKALDMERMRQYEIRKKLDELYKIELVNKVRSERGGKSKEELYALLSPRSGGTRKKSRRSVKSAANTSSEREMTKLPEINFDERTRLLKYETTSVDSGSDSASRYTAPRPPKQPSAGRSVSAHTYGSKAPHPPPPKSKKKKKRKIHRGLMLAKSEQMVAHRVQVQSMAEVTMKFLGSNLQLASDMFPANKLSEIQVIQQHCGASTVCVFREMIPPNTVFTFVSRRHRGSPFGLTINIDGIKNIRISSCCEYKHKPGYRLGGKNSQFGLISVQGAAPCYRCQVRLNLLDKNNNEAEKEASSDEEAATRSFDIIVSRGGKRQEAVRERPISANVTTQTDASLLLPNSQEDDESAKEKDAVALTEQYQDDFDDDFEADENDSKNGDDDLNENVSSSSESDSSDNESDKDSDTESSDTESDSEKDKSENSGEKQMDNSLTETDDTITSTNQQRDEEDEHQPSDVDARSDADSDTDVAKKSDTYDDHDDHDDDKEHVNLEQEDSKKRDSDSESDKESVKSDGDGRRSSVSSESDSSDDNEKDKNLKDNEEEVEEGKDDVKDNEEQHNAKLADDLIEKIEHMNIEDEPEHQPKEEKQDHNDDEESNQLEGKEEDVENEDGAGEYEEEMAPSTPSVVSRESTMLTGNEDGRFESENKTIQFNEEVDVVHYEKVDVESSANDGNGDSSDDGSDADDDDDFDGALNNGRERVILADLGLDDDDLEVESDDIIIDSDGDIKEVPKNKEEENFSLEEGEKSDDNDHRIFDRGLDPSNTTIDQNNNNVTTYPRDQSEEPIKSLIGDDPSHVDLVNLKLSSEQTEELALLLEERKDDIENLSLRNVELEGGLERIKHFVMTMNNLKVLNLNDSDINIQQAPHLTDILSTCKSTLTTVALNGNPLGNDGITSVLDAVTDSVTLTSLDIGRCEIADTGAEQIGELLRKNQSVVELTMGWNTITKEGWIHISNALKCNTTLKTLSIDACQIADEELKVICQGIADNKSLQGVDMEANIFTDKGVEALIQAIEKCETLLDVTIEPCENVSQEMQEQVREVLEKRVEGL